jgi:hypothetical protein
MHSIVFYDNLQIWFFQSANTQSSIDMPKASTSSESKLIEAPKSFDKSNFILKLMAKEPNITWYKTVMNVEENFLRRNKEIGKIDC